MKKRPNKWDRYQVRTSGHLLGDHYYRVVGTKDCTSNCLQRTKCKDVMLHQVIGRFGSKKDYLPMGWCMHVENFHFEVKNEKSKH